MVEKEENGPEELYGLRVRGPFSEKGVKQEITAKDMRGTIGDVLKKLMQQDDPEARALSDEVGSRITECEIFLKRSDGRRLLVRYDQRVGDLVEVVRKNSDSPMQMGRLDLEIAPKVVGGYLY